VTARGCKEGREGVVDEGRMMFEMLSPVEIVERSKGGGMLR